MLSDLFTQVAREESVKLLSIEPHPFVAIDAEPEVRDVRVQIQVSGSPTNALNYIQHIERVAPGCRAGADAIVESRFQTGNAPVSVVFDCDLSKINSTR